MAAAEETASATSAAAKTKYRNAFMLPLQVVARHSTGLFRAKNRLP
jgi:hypothetical protein